MTWFSPLCGYLKNLLSRKRTGNYRIFVIKGTRLDFHRKGIVYVEDLKGIKLKSFGMQNSKEVSHALTVSENSLENSNV